MKYWIFSERMESRISKKETSKDETKIKESEMKPKRSNVSTNGNKDNGEILAKVIRIFL